MSDNDDTKAQHKMSAAAANDKDAYDDTEFGRRPVSKCPKALQTLFHLIAIPTWSVFRPLKRSHKA